MGLVPPSRACSSAGCGYIVVAGDDGSPTPRDRGSWSARPRSARPRRDRTSTRHPQRHRRVERDGRERGPAGGPHARATARRRDCAHRRGRHRRHARPAGLRSAGFTRRHEDEADDAAPPRRVRRRDGRRRARGSPSPTATSPASSTTTTPMPPRRSGEARGRPRQGRRRTSPTRSPRPVAGVDRAGRHRDRRHQRRHPHAVGVERTADGLEFDLADDNPTAYPSYVHIGNPPVIGSDGVVYGIYESPDLATVPITPAKRFGRMDDRGRRARRRSPA